MSSSPGKTIESLEFKNVRIGYSSQVGAGPISLKFEPGQVYWIRGESGAGKSTFLKTLAGLIPPLEGAFLVNGESVDDMSFEEFLPYRLNIGYGFSSGGLLNNKTLLENLILPLIYHGRRPYAEAQTAVLSVMTDMGIEKYAHTRPALAPEGVVKLAGLIRTFLMDPQIVILDDPTWGLDTIRSERISRWVSFYRLRNRNSLFFVASDHEDFLHGFPTVEICIADGEIWAVEQAEIGGVG